MNFLPSHKNRAISRMPFSIFLKRSALCDSLYALEKTKQIAELNTRYETAQKEQQIQNQKINSGCKTFCLLALPVWSY